MMQVNTIDLGDGLRAFEFLLNPQDQKRSEPKQDPVKTNLSELERLAKLYYNEKLVTIDDIRYPFVYVADSELDRITLNKIDEPYRVPEKFRIFVEEAIKGKKFYETPHMSVADWSFSNDDDQKPSMNISVKPVGYGEFLGTNRSIDVPLSRYDPSFKEGETLRSYEIRDGKALRPAESKLSNMLGLGFVITAVGQDGKAYFLFGRRGNNLAVEGGTISIFGGTPEWKDIHIKDNILQEMGEELLITPDEFRMHRCYLAHDFTRAPDIFTHINITGPRALS